MRVLGFDISNLTTEEAAYLAGLFDGEGTISIRRSKCNTGFSYVGYAEIGMTDERAIRWVAEKLQSHYKTWVPKNPRHKTYYMVYLTGRSRMIPFLEIILPYMITKRQLGQVVLKLYDLQKDCHSHRTRRTHSYAIKPPNGPVRMVHSVALSHERVAQYEELYQQCKTLNRRGRQ